MVFLPRIEVDPPLFLATKKSTQRRKEDRRTVKTMAKIEARCTTWVASVGVLEAVAQALAVAVHDVVAFISKRMRSLEVVRESKE